MKTKNGLIAITLISSCLNTGCSKTNIDTNEQEVVNEVEDTLESVLKDNLTINTIPLDNKEHTFLIEEERPIIESFTEINKDSSLDIIIDLFLKTGNINRKDLESGEIVLSVINNELEEVSVTYKDNSVISKTYKKDTFENKNINTVFVNYNSDLSKEKLYSGIYTEEENINISPNRSEWDIEEEMFKLFN